MADIARVTLITRNFPPLTGGMERLVHQVYLRIVDRHECLLIGPYGCKTYARTEGQVIETSVSPTPLFLLLSFIKSLWTQWRIAKPDIVVGGSGVVGPIVVLLANVFGAKSIIFVHGLDLIVDSTLYQWFFLPFLRRVDMVISNSTNTTRLAIANGIRRVRIETINPGVDLPRKPMGHEEAKTILNMADKSVLLSVGRLIPRKGLAEFITNTFVKLVEQDPSVHLLIAGSEPRNALNRTEGSVLSKIKSAIEVNNLQDNVTLLGRVDEKRLEQLYAGADVFIFPLKETKGDVEGFGMVSVEAAAYGTPTVAFDCGGVGDAVKPGRSGYLVNPEDYGKFRDLVITALGEDLRCSSKKFARQFSWQSYFESLQMCFEKVMQED